MKLLITNGTVVTHGTKGQIIENGAVLTNGPIIEKVGQKHEIQDDQAKVIDAQGGLIMPGLINTHMHLYSTFARGMALAGPGPQNFVEILEKLWWQLDKALLLKDIQYSALIPLIACLRSGTTSIIDHHASPGAVNNSLSTIFKALQMIPVRSCLCYEVSDRDGPEVFQQGLDENIAWQKECSDQNNTMFKALFGLHAAFTLSEESLQQCSQLGHAYNMGFHIHTAEDLADQDYNMKHYNKRVVQRLADHNLLGDNSICVHCVHIDEQEIEILANSKTNVVHNPQSNMNNAVGTTNLAALLDSGITVGLGTDGMSSDMRHEAAAVSLAQRAAFGDPQLGFMESGTLLFENNASIASHIFGATVGELTSQAVADIAVFDYQPPTPLTMENFLGHFLFGIRYSTCHHTIINGQHVFSNGVCSTINEAEVVQTSRQQAQNLWSRMQA